jgi:hypothetical protein
MIGESEVACHLPAVSTTLTIALSLVRGRKVCPGKVPLSLRTKAAGLGSAAFSGSWGWGWLVYRLLPPPLLRRQFCRLRYSLPIMEEAGTCCPREAHLPPER